jgi:glucosamine-phosphate N-acetyltransferase
MIVKTSFNKPKDILFTDLDDQNNERGYGCLIIHDRPYNLGRVGLIEDIFTHAEYRSQGVARRIIESIIEEAKSLGAYKLVLQCSTGNLGLYEKFGFIKHQHSLRLNLNG